MSKIEAIENLDLRTKDGILRSMVEATKRAIEALCQIWETQECWIEWNEIEWPWNLTTEEDFARRGRRHLRSYDPAVIRELQHLNASDMTWSASNPTWTHLIVPGAGIFEIDRDIQGF